MSWASWTTRPLDPAEAAIIHHPDRRTAWAPSLVVTTPAALDQQLLGERLASLESRHPILTARLHRDTWVAGPTHTGIAVRGDEHAFLRGRFDLTADPPLRAALSADGRRLLLVGHHAALDGRALVALARGLLGAQPFPPRHSGPAAAQPSALEAGLSGSPVDAAAALRRLTHPADRVAPSKAAPAEESFAVATLPESVGSSIRAAGIAAAAAAAAGAWNARAGAPWRRVGLTIAVGGPDVIGNVATHRRVDLESGANAKAVVTAALAAAHTTAEQAPSPTAMRLLGPVVDRFSDSLLISNLGRLEVPGADRVDFYPVARGRSAVALGAASVRGGDRRLTLRARDLTLDDAQWLLDTTIDLLTPREHDA